MNTNIINSQFAIECFSGSLSVIGKNRNGLVLSLRGHTVDDLKRELPSFCKNPIFMNEIGSHEKVLIFEYSLRGELRNPRKLLKSIRNKLVQTSFRNQSKDEQEFNEMYTMTGRQEHAMWADMANN